MKNLVNVVECDYLNNSIEVIDYTGKYPSLCMGKLIVVVNGQRHEWQGCLRSGGVCAVNFDGDEIVRQGDWQVRLPYGFEEYQPQVQEWVNANVPQGCCGGCI